MAVPSDAVPIQPSPAPAAVELLSVTKVFGAVPALVRVDLRVQRGETLLVRGPNAAGKTTLLRVMATALSPTYGRGTVLGLDLLTRRDDIRRRTELVGPRTRLYEDLTVEENLLFASRLYELEGRDVSGAIERMGLGEVARERARGLSQGMRQRVALARALMRSADLLLLDEPYAGLDVSARDLVDGEVLSARVHGRTVVLATHDPLVERIATRTVRMEAGRLLAGVAA